MVNHAGMRFFGESTGHPHLLAGLVAGLLVFGTSGSSIAQDAAGADPFAGVEEMVVLGSETVGTLTDATVSVTSFDASDLEALGVGDVSDVAQFTPNLEIRTAGSTAATFFIRGVGLNDFTANASGSVAIYVDDAPKNLPAIQLGQLFDLEGVEVLKGPQGSGPGRNASAGAIRVFTKKPTGEFNASARFDYGNYDYIDAEGALEIPILEDVLATRMSFRLQQRDGIVENRCGGLSQNDINTVQGPCASDNVRPGLDEDLNDMDKWAGRITTRYLPPIEDMEWNFTFHGGRLDQFGTVGQHIGTFPSAYGAPDRLGYRQPEITKERANIIETLNIPTNRECRNSPDPPACREEQTRLRQEADFLLSERLGARPLDKKPFEGDYNTPGYERQTNWGLLLGGDWQIADLTLKSITGFERYDRERLIDADYSPNIFFEFQIEDDAWQFNQDLRLGGELEDTPLTWNTGVFYLQEELDYAQNTLATQPLEPFRQEYVQKTWSFGAFADIAWDFLDDFTFEGGARYNWEQKRFEADIVRGPIGAGASPQCEPNANGEIPPCQRTTTVDHPTGTVSLKYRIDELRSVYVKYSHGWKGAQFNIRSGIVGDEVTDVASPEKIDAFELGFAGSWIEDRLKLSGAFFWYDYQDYQVFTFTNDTGTVPQRIVINANDAQLYGAELEGTLEPIDTLIFDLRFGWLESKFLDFTDSVVRPVTENSFFRQVFDFNGNQLPNAPRFKVSGSIQYSLDLVGMGTLIPRWDFSWTDDVNFNPSGGTGAPNIAGEIFMPRNAIGQDSYLIQNVRLTYQAPSGNMEIAGWVRNVTNEVYKTLSFDASGGPGFVGNLLGDPRTYGISASVRF
jgi:iron complex outermembrane receptor protein